MIVCSCNRLSDRDVRACRDHACGVGSVYKSLGCAPKCGRCAGTIGAILNERRETARKPAPLVGEEVARAAA